MIKFSFRIAAVLTVAFTFGCRPGADEQQVQPERFSYSCYRFITEPMPMEDLCTWEPHLPPPGRMLLDLYFPRKTDGEMVASEPTSRVLPSEISAVQAAGGRIDYIFNVPILRVEIDRDAIPKLAHSRDGVVQWASTPIDLGAPELGVRIFLSRPARKSDAELIEGLGGRVWAQPDPVNDGRPMMDACVPDKGIPRVRALPGLDFIRPGGTKRCSEFLTFEDGLANPERRVPPPPKRLDARLETPARVRVGQAVPITLVIQNVHEHTMQLRARIPMPEIVVTARDDSVVWHRFGPRRLLGNVQTWSLAPGEILRFQAEWDQRGNDGRGVPPGRYSVQAGLFFSNLDSFAEGSLRIVP